MNLESLGISKVNSGACIGGQDWIDCSKNDTVISYNPSNGSEISKIALSDKSVSTPFEGTVSTIFSFRNIDVPKHWPSSP